MVEFVIAYIWHQVLRKGDGFSCLLFYVPAPIGCTYFISRYYFYTYHIVAYYWQPKLLGKS